MNCEHSAAERLVPEWERLERFQRQDVVLQTR